MKATFSVNNYEFSFDDSDVVQASDYIPKGEFNPHNVRPWFAHDHGYCVGVCFADCEQDALDILADEGKLDRFQVADEDMADYGEEEEGIARLGNAGEPFDIETLGIFALPHVPFSFAAMFMAAQAEADQTAQARTANFCPQCDAEVETQETAQGTCKVHGAVLIPSP